MGTAAAVISAALGTGELVLLALALSHVIDPGWPAFETIGTIAGVGTSVGVAIVDSGSGISDPRSSARLG